MEDSKSTYWQNIKDAFQSLGTGLKLTLNHISKPGKKAAPDQAIWEKDYFEPGDAAFTLQYPHEKMPIPETGRYKLHNEIEDCIVCDKCAKICPVDCIEIEAIKSPEEIGKTSDGTSKRLYAAKFDIDMAKCCFCGLCTTVCPTECLTMTSEYDFSAFDFKEHNFAFGEMTPLEILEKKQAWEQHQAEKEQKQNVAKPIAEEKPETAKAAAPFRPKMPVIKPLAKKESSSEEATPAKVDDKSDDSESTSNPKPKPVFKPRAIVPKSNPKPATDSETEEKPSAETKPAFKPKPMIPKKPGSGKEDNS